MWGVTSYELDLFGRVRSLNRQALETYFATAEARRSSHLSLVAEVATQYLTEIQADAQLAVARQTLAAVQNSYDLNKRSYDEGISSELDLQTSVAQVGTAQANIADYVRQRAQAENALVLLVGQPLPTNLQRRSRWRRSSFPLICRRDCLRICCCAVRTFWKPSTP